MRSNSASVGTCFLPAASTWMAPELALIGTAGAPTDGRLRTTWTAAGVTQYAQSPQIAAAMGRLPPRRHSVNFIRRYLATQKGSDPLRPPGQYRNRSRRRQQGH